VPQYAYADGTADGTADSTDGVISINAPGGFCYIGETIGIEVIDPDFNINSDTQDSVTVNVSSTSMMEEQEQLLSTVAVDLVETEANSGKFYGNVRVSSVSGSAIAVKEIQGEISGKIRAEYNDNGTNKISDPITVADAMLMGSVSDPDNAPATGGNIEVVKVADDQKHQFIGAYPIHPDGGTYQIPRLPEGRYQVRAHQSENTDQMGSLWLEIYVNTDGTCNDKDGLPLSTYNFQFQKVQFSGTVRDKDMNTLLYNEFNLEIRSLNPEIGHNVFLDWESKDGVYRAAALADGEYAIRAVSQKEGSTDSCELFFSIEDGTVTDPSTGNPLTSFDLQLTEPQVSGVVYYSGEDHQPVANSSVVVFDSDWRYVFAKQTDEMGSFRIGGLMPGYKLQAGNQGHEDYTPENMIEIEVDEFNQITPANVELFLKKKELKLKWVDAFVRHYNEIRIVIENTSLLTDDGSGLTATITPDGTTAAINLGAVRRGETWGEEGAFYFNVDESIRSNLSFGKYTVEIKNNGVILPYENNQLDIIQQLQLIPGVAELSQYQNGNTNFSLDVDEVDHVRLYPWSVGEELTVKVIKADDQRNIEDTITLTVPEEKILQISLSAHTSAEAGRRDIELYRGTQLIALGGFDVGVSTIGFVTANEGSDEAAIWGEYLGSYLPGQTRAELWLDGDKLADSLHTYVGGDVRFQFDYNFKTSLHYTLKVFMNDEEKELPGNGAFEAVPRLDWSRGDFTSNTNKSFTVEESSLPSFGWSSTDNLSINLYGPDAWNYEMKGDNLLVSDQNLMFTLTEGEGRNFPLCEGEYYLSVNKDNLPVGFAELIVAYDEADVLCGTAKGSDGEYADGGFIDVGKEGEDWGERLTVGHDGRFYAFKYRLRGSGSYYMTAIPSETSADASGRVFFNVENDDFSTGVTINLNAVQITGTVQAITEAGTVAVQGGYVDVLDPSQNFRRVQSTPISPNGSYKLGGLESGKKYYLNANGSWDMDYFSSDLMEIIYNGSPLTGKDIILNQSQITGTAKDGNGNDLLGDQYEVIIRSMGNYDSRSEVKTRDGKFLLGNLQPGRYAIAIAPRGLSQYARSNETIINVDNNGVAIPNNITLELTQPMLTGSVYDKNGQLVTTDGYVEVWEDRLDGSGYIYSIPLIDGTYKVGGLPEGNYKIRAGASDYTELYNSNSMSKFEIVTLASIAKTQNLYLTDRAMPRIMWVNNAQIGNDRITARILNYRKLDISKFAAEVLKADGSKLNPELLISGNHMNIAWTNYNSDEADLELYLDNNLQVDLGKYMVKLTYDGAPVINDQNGANVFDVTYNLGVLPKGVLPEAAQGISLRLYVDDLQGGYKDDLWDSDDILSVKLIASDGKEYSGLSCTKNVDSTLTVTLPDKLENGKLSDGWATVKLYKEEWLAIGYLQVGEPVIEGVDDTSEWSDRISLRGSYLALYDNTKTIAKILDASDNELWESKGFELLDDRMEFWFDGLNLPAGEYKFNLISDNKLIITRSFYIAPWVVCTPHAIASGMSAQLLVKKTSLMDIFQWSQSDIINLKVRIGGPAHWYEIDSNNGLSFDGDNLKVDISGPDGEALLSQTGSCWLEVYINDRRIGYSYLTIGQDAVSATVKDPDAYVVPKARVRITNLNQDDNNSTEVMTDSEGRFYISKQDLPRRDDSSFNGDYSFLVMAPYDSKYATSQTIFTIDADQNNDLTLTLAQPQITGVVRAGGLNANGGAIEVQKQDEDHWSYLFDFNLNQDGVFKVGGLTEGTYFFRAHEDDQNKDYVPSDFIEVQVKGTTVSNITLDLNPIQIRGTALDPMGGLLKGDQYSVNVRPLDQVNKDCYGEWLSEDEAFRIGALRPGRYAISLQSNLNTTYTPSLETIITVKADGTVENSNITIRLTQPKLTGTVSIDGKAFSQGYVDVFNGTWQRLNYVTTLELDEQGRFKIGGIPDGTYYIRAAIWRESDYRVAYSQSVMTQINLGTTNTIELSIVDNILPRIRSIDTPLIGDDRISVHVINRSGIKDFNKLSARIHDQNNNEVGKLITGGENFFFDGGYDEDKDEGNLCVAINGNIRLSAGKYSLKLFYDNKELVNETPSTDGFYILNGLNVVPLGVTPEDAKGKVLKLEVYSDDNRYQWPSSDKVAVRLYKPDGSYDTLEETITADNTMTVTLPDLGIGYDYYCSIMVYVENQLFAKGDLYVGYPSADGIGGITEESPDIQIYGQNLNVYMDGTTKAEIYDSTETKLLLTCNKPYYLDNNIVFNFDDMRFAPGEYILKLYYKNNQEISLPNDGRFRSVDVLSATPAYYTANALANKSVTLTLADGSDAPWKAGDALKIYIHPDWNYGRADYVVTPAASDVTDQSVTFSFAENINWVGHCSIMVYKVEEGGNEIYAGYAHFNLIDKEQLAGTVKDAAGRPVPYAYVYVKNIQDDSYQGFNVDSNGKYGIFGLMPGEYRAFATSPKGLPFIDSDGIDITINSDGNSDTVAHDFSLKPGRRISGTISLPNGVNAPAEGFSGWIAAWNDNNTPDNPEDDPYLGTDIVFQGGANAADYSIIVPEELGTYYIETWCGGLGLLNTSNFYSTDKSVDTLAEADMVNVELGDQENIDLQLRQGNAISGTIRLPSGTAPEGGIEVEIHVNDDKDNDNYKDDMNGSIRVIIPEDQSSAEYTIIVAPSDKYTMEYRIDPKYLYFNNGFYQTSTKTAYDREQAVEVNGTGNLTGIDMMLIPVKLITGTISLPQDYSIPEGGVTGFIAALIGKNTEDEADDRWRGTGFEIKSGTSTEYTIAVPAEWNNLSIELWSDAPELVNCTTFYSENGSVFNREAATLLSLKYDVNEGIDINLVKGKAITGTITLPSAAPQGGISLIIQAIRNNDILNRRDDIIAERMVSISEGQTSATYTIYVPAMDGYKVNYASDPAYLYEDKGYYSTKGTVFNFNSATAINVSNHVSGIDLTVSLLKHPICDKAEVTADGTSVQLYFSKPLDVATIPTNPAGFALKVGSTSYEVDKAVLVEMGTLLTLHLKDYKIFKDYKDIKITYDATAGIKSKDGLKLEGFENDVFNNSTKEFSILRNFVGALLNKKAVINVIAEGEVLTITDNGVSIATGSGKASAEISTEGSHEVVVTIAGRKQKTTYNFTIDTTAPVVEISNPQNGTILKNNQDGITPIITFSADSVEATRMISLNGGTLSATTSNGKLTYAGDPIREAGHYVLTATAKDAAGNIRTVTHTFDIVWDNSSPVITINGVKNGGVYETATISVSLDSDTNTLPEYSNQANYSYKSSLKLPNGNVVTKENGVPALTGPGAYRLEIVATNPSYTDKTSSKIVEFIIDNSAPTVAVGGVEDNAVYHYGVTPIISFTDDVTSQQLLLNNAEVTLRRSGALVTYHMGDTISLDGDYVLTAKTKDAMNHVSNVVTKSFTIDKTKPVISITGAFNGATYKDQSVTLTIKTNEGNLTVLNASGEPITLNNSGQYTFSGTANQVVNYKVTAKAVDAAGNTTEQQLSFSIDRLAVNIMINGVTEGMVVNSGLDISFTTFEGTQEKQGTTVTIDGIAFIGGNYSIAGAHTLIAKFISKEITYTKTLHFTIDKTAPTVSIIGVSKNAEPDSDNIIAKAGDVITVRAKVTDQGGVGDVILSIGTTAVSMQYIEAEDYYEGKFNVEGGSFDDLVISVSAKDKAGNLASQSYTKTLTIDNTKPLVSLNTSPAVADGNNGIFKSPTMKVTLTAGAKDTLHWNLNGKDDFAASSKELTPSQGTNVLFYYAMDLAGNVSDKKVYVFEFDSIQPADVTLTSPTTGTTSMEYVKINGTVTGEGPTTGAKVLLKKSGEVIAKASVKAGGSFDFDGIRLTEGRNAFSITAIDLAGNQSQNAVTLTRTLDSTVPVLQVEKTDDTHYTITSSENITQPIVKFNGDVISADLVTAVPAGQKKIYHVITPQPIEGTNILNATALDEVGNMGTGSYTSTYIPPNTAHNDLPLNDNATMNIPDNAFDTSTQILVKTVDVNGITNYKPIGAAISFNFINDQGTPIDPTAPLLIKNYIGVGLNGIVLMHVNENGVVDRTLTAKVVMSTDPEIDGMGVDDPYYLIDTGYLIFKTTKFSSYQVAQDNIAPVLAVTTSNFVINKAVKDAGGMKIEGSITDADPNVTITQVLIDGVSMDISGIPAANLDVSFSIPLDLRDGEHEVTIKASDTAGNSTTVIRNYIVDITSPTLTAVAAATNTNRNFVDISINTGENAEIFINGVSKGQLNGGGIIVFTLTDNAVNTINVTATDTFGNTTAAKSISVTRDSTAPAITITGVSNGDVYGNSVTIGVSVTDPHTPNTSITVDGKDYKPGVFSSEGQHTLVVSSSDSYGNTSSRTVIFTIDKSVPVINVTGANGGGKYATDKALNITADNIDELIITKVTDNQSPVNVNATVTGTSASASVSLGVAGEQHNYTISITAKKTVGGQLRWASTTINLTVDRKNPVITSTTSTQTENATINLTGTLDETADIYLDKTLIISGNPAGKFSITGQSLKLGANTFLIKAVDEVGNETLLTISVTRTNNGGNPGGGNPGGGNPGGGNPGGGNPGGGNPGGAPGGVVPSEDNKDDKTKPEAPVQTDTSETNKPESKPQFITEKPVKKGSIATATTSEAELNTAITEAKEDINGVKTVKIEIQKVKGVKVYTEILPVSVMQAGGEDLNIQIVTPIGTITVPGNMFASKDVKNKSNLGISITAADKSKLDEKTLKAIGSRPILQLSASADGKAVTWNNVNAPVTIAIPYKPTAKELKNPDHIVVWYIDGKGKVQTVPNGRYDAKTGMVTFTTTHFSTFAVAYVMKSFKDIAGLDTKTEIEFVASKGIMNGKTDTKFDPEGKVIRGDFIAYLMNTLSLTTEVNTNFADVKATNPNYNAIGTAKKLGILSGSSKSKFYADELITKEEMAIYVVSAMELSQKSLKSATRKDLSKFNDAAKVSNSSVTSMAKLIKSGILSISGKKLNAKASLTRAEVAEILYNIYKAK
jgi:hypothetical protein